VTDATDATDAAHAQNEANPTSKWAFAHVDRVRFGDLDAMRHLNNVAFLGFFEDARVHYIRTLLDDDGPHERKGFGLIFAECKINYRSPGYFGEEIRTSIRPAEIARSSLRMEFAMHALPDERLLAEGYGVVVGYDYAAGRSMPLPDYFRARLTGT
jgi:acyl-CoA thioester hydrolase